MTRPVRLAYRLEGPADGPPVVLAPSLGTTMALWDGLAAVLEDRYRLIRLDLRGHGGSPVPSGPYAMAELVGDVVRLADELRLERFALVGLSIGGALGQLLALEHPGRLTSLVLGCTVPRFGDPATWLDRAAQVRAEGMASLAEPTRGRWFTDRFREDRPDEVERLVAMLTSTPVEGYAGCCEALACFDAWARMGELRTPTRVVAGDRDPSATLPDVRQMAERIPGADLVVLREVSHIANVADPTGFNSAVLEHLERTR
jgi:3-oxoadipate enol-lactonase